MTTLHTTNSWNVGKAGPACAACGTALAPDTPCWAALCDGGKMAVRHAPEVPAKAARKGEMHEPAASPFVRVDFCEACWAAGKRPEELDTLLGEPLEPGSRLTMFSYWKTVVPASQQKKKLLVDDSVLMDVFARMEGKNEPQEVRFRFVLALILMRKRLLKYEGMEESGKPGTSDRVAGQGSAAAGAVSAERLPEVWRMMPRGAAANAQMAPGIENGAEPESRIVRVINPHLSADQIAEVSQQLSAILAEEV